METLGPLQLRVMRLMWTSGSATVHGVHAALNLESEGAPLAYTTVLSVMRNLARRGFLSQQPAGRSHVFAAVIGEESFKRKVLRQVCDSMFAGQIENLLHFVVSRDGPAGQEQQLANAR
jgi:predicted transcriptional regulator